MRQGKVSIFFSLNFADIKTNNFLLVRCQRCIHNTFMLQLILKEFFFSFFLHFLFSLNILETYTYHIYKVVDVRIQINKFHQAEIQRRISKNFKCMSNPSVNLCHFINTYRYLRTHYTINKYLTIISILILCMVHTFYSSHELKKRVLFYNELVCE